LRATYYSDYCPKGGTWVVFDEPLSFTTPSKKSDNPRISYNAALLNVPAAFAVPRKVFYVKVHYDKSLDVNRGLICPAVVYPEMKAVVCDWAGESCD